MSSQKFIIIVAVILTALFIQPVQAAVCSNPQDCQEKIKEYESKLNQAKQEKSSLSSQIKLMNAKVDLAQAKLTKTEADVQIMQAEIEELGSRINELNETLNHLSTVLLHKIVEGYKQRNLSLFELLLSPQATTLANQVKYIHIAEENDRVLAIKTQQVKVNFSEQKNLREEKKKELEALEQQLELQKTELKNQVGQKQVLLDQTKGDEKKYQELLGQALAEFQAVNKALETGQKVGPVKKGDAIALVGNTGFPYCSTGAHLHFEVRKDGTWTDPGGYIGGGKDWQMPLNDPVTITQGYGVTPWSFRYTYSGGIHTGWDMVSGGSDVIHAVADGTLYSSSQNCSGAIIKIKYIDHGGGVMSFYLHVQ